MPASALTSEERIAAAADASQAGYGTAAEPPATGPDEQPATAADPAEIASSEPTEAKARSRKPRNARASSIGKHEPSIASDEVSQVDIGAVAEPTSVAPDASVAASADAFPVEPDVAAAPARQSKKAKVLGLLQRPQGAAVAELMTATGWQSHSVRAALTGFRKEGTELIRTKDDASVTRYHIAVEG